MFSAASRFILVLVMFFAALAPVSSQTADERFVFRYKPGLQDGSGGPGGGAAPPPAAGGDAIHAHYVMVTGEAFEAPIPMRPGTSVTRWRTDTGSFPPGIALDENTGVLSGVAGPPETGRQARLSGLDGFDQAGTTANVTFTVISPSDDMGSVDFYSHTGRFSSHRIPLIDTIPVYRWETVIDIPEGFVLTPGFLEGTAPHAGVFPVAFRGYDYLDNEVMLVYGQLTVEDGPNVAFVEDVMRHPSQMFAVSAKVARSVGEIVWGIEGDPLHANLGLDVRDGVVRGSVPTYSTSGVFRFKAVDVDGAVGHSNWFRISTTGPDTDLADLSNMSIPVDVPFGMGLKADELVGTPSWRVAEGSLPPGLALDPETGFLWGTPAEIGLSEGIVIEVTSSSGHDAVSSPFSIDVYEAFEILADERRHSVRVDHPVATPQVQARGATHPYAFSVAEGFDMPDGLDLDPATGVLTGVLTEPGVYPVPVTVTDAGGRTGGPFTFEVTAYAPLAASVVPSVIETARGAPMNAQPVLAELSAMPGPGGEGPSWAFVGTPPGWVSFDGGTGAMTGVPHGEGDYGPFWLDVTDGSGDVARTNAFTLRVLPPSPLVVEPWFTNVKRYVRNPNPLVRVIDPKANVTFSLSGGTLPEGLTLNSRGYLDGITEVNDGEVTDIVVYAMDSIGNEGLSEAFAITLVDPDELVARDFVFRWPAGAPFTTDAPSVRNAVGDLSWGLVGELPPGVSFDSASGTFSGTLGLGDYGTVVAASDESGRSVDVDVTFEMHAGIHLTYGGPVLVATEGGSAMFLPQVEDATGEVSFALEGSLPPGIGFDPSTGEIHGVPSQEGEWHGLSVTAVDEAGTSDTALFAIEVRPAAGFVLDYDFSSPLQRSTSIGLPKGPVQPTNAVGDVVYEVAGGLPPGIHFTAQGRFDGVPTETGTWGGIVVTGVDGDGTVAVTEPIEIRVVMPGEISVANRIEVRTREMAEFTSPSPSPTNVVAPVSYALGEGAALPDGVSFDPLTGRLTGAVAQGLYSLPVTVTDSIGRSKDFTKVIQSFGPLTVTMPDPAVFSAHKQGMRTAVASEIIGVPSYQLSGTLPEGLSLDPATGAVSGTPVDEVTVPGLVMTVTDSHDQSVADATFTLEVGPRDGFAVSVPAENVAVGHSTWALTPKVEGAVGDVSFSLEGTLPPGLSFFPGTGKIEGTPVELGQWTGLVITATDSVEGMAVTEAFSISVIPDGEPIILILEDLTVRMGERFSTSLPVVLNAYGDVRFETIELESEGLTVDEATGVISGLSANPRRIQGHVYVFDSTNRLTSEPIIIDVLPHPAVTYQESYDLNMGSLVDPVRVPVTNYGIGTLSYELAGTLPPGLSFSTSTGGISGTPTAVGTWPGLVVRVTDSHDGSQVLTEPFTIRIRPFGAVPSVSVPTDVFLVIAGEAVTVPFQPTVTNPKEGDVVTLSPALPSGLTMAQDGSISGTSTDIDLHEGYHYTVTDVNGLSGRSRDFSILVRSGSLLSFTAPETVQVRDGEPFTIPLAAHDPASVTGTLRFTLDKAGHPVHVQPGSGTVSGMLSEGGGLPTLTAADAAGTYPVPLGLERVTLAVSFDVSGIDPVRPNLAFELPPPAVSSLRGSPWFTLAGTPPAGLSIDGSTGIVSGTVQSLAPVEFRIRVTDAYGEAMTSQIVIQPVMGATPVFTAQSREFRTGVPFETEPVSVQNAESLPGPVTYAIVSAQAGLSINPSTGVISGLLTASVTHNVTLRAYHDGVQVGTDFHLALSPVTLTASLQGRTVPVGASVDVMPSSTGVLGEPVWSLEAQHAMPPGLSADPLTGRVTGEVPFGSWSLRLALTDSGETVRSGWATFRGTSEEPLNLDFTPLTGQEHATEVLSNVVPVTGIAGDRMVSVASVPLHAPFFRVCHDPVCQSVKHGWTGAQTQRVVSNGDYVQMRGTVPWGDLQTVTYTIVFHGLDPVQGTWDVTSGVMAGIPDASTVLPVTATRGPSFEIDHRHLYDGQSATGFSGWGQSDSTSIYYDFGRAVSFDSYTVEKQLTGAAYRHRLQILDGANWVDVHIGPNGGGTWTFPVVTAQHIRLQGGTSSNSLRQFRIGSGGAHLPPGIVSPTAPEVLAMSGPAAKTVPLQAAPSASPYAVVNAVTWTLESGTPPPGAELSEGNLLLPPVSETGEGWWNFSLRATDTLGFTAVGAFTVTSEAVDASTVLPVSMTVQTDVGSIPMLYDGVTSGSFGGVHVPSGQSLQLDFGQTVHFDRIMVSQSNGSGSRMEIEALGPDGWTPVRAQSGSVNSEFTFPVVAARHLRVNSTGTNGFTGINLTEFRVGSGPAYSAPAFSGDPVIVEPAARQVNLQAVLDTHYGTGTAEFTLLENDLPTGASLSSTGILSVPSVHVTGPGTWTARIRISDGTGQHADHILALADSDVPLASVTVAPTVTLGGAAVNNFAFYDGVENVRAANVTAASPLIVDFGRHVRFGSVYWSSETNLLGLDFVTVEIETQPGTWLLVGTMHGVGRGTVDLGTQYTARRMRFRNPNGSWPVTELRVGAGPRYQPPSYTLPVTHFNHLANLGAAPTEVALPLSVTEAYAGAAMDFQVLNGSFPDGYSLSSQGVLSLPARSSVAGLLWRATIRATDSVGGSVDFDVVISRDDMTPASVVAPYAAGRIGETATPALAEALYTAADANISVANNGGIEFLFSEPVTADSFRIRRTGGGTIRILGLAESGDWITLAEVNTSAVGGNMNMRSASNLGKSSTAFRFIHVGTGRIYHDFQFGLSNLYAPWD